MWYDVIMTWKYFPHFWPFVMRNHWSTGGFLSKLAEYIWNIDFPSSSTTCWTNRRCAGDLGHFYAKLFHWTCVIANIHFSLSGGIIRPSTICTADKYMRSRWTWRMYTIWYSRQLHDDVIKWNHWPSYWPFVRGIHWSLVNSLYKGQWRGALMFLWSTPEQTIK